MALSCQHLRSAGLQGRRSVRPSRTPTVRTQALFGFGKKDTSKDEEKEEMWRAQQELLEARRTGKTLQDASQRRQRVSETLAERKAARRAERDALARGEMPDSLKNWRNYSNKEDEDATSGLVVPLLPFGMPKFDAGERFDLRQPYSDDGWVDPEETDAWAGFKNIGSKLLNFSGRSKPQELKPIIWASEYSKYKQQKQQEQQQQKGKGPKK